MLCPKCNKDLPSGAVYCCFCGRLLAPVPRSHKKRANNEGHVFKRGSTWTVRVSYYAYDPDGHLVRKRKTKGGFKTAQAAGAFAYELKNGPVTAPTISLAELFDQWQRGYSSRISASTMAGYVSAFKHYSSLHSRTVQLIKAVDLQQCLDRSSAGKRTKQLMKVIAGLLWKYAIDCDVVSKNVAANLYTGNEKSVPHESFTDLELHRLRQAAADGLPYADYVVALCFTGFRPGELLALKKSSVNLSAGYLIGGGKTEAGTNRVVTIPPAIQSIIRQRMDQPGEYLFPNLKTGQRMTHDYFRSFCFEPLMAQLKITDRVPYSCRHTYSNLIKRAPGDAGDKARLMGHTDYTFTQERYQSSALADLKLITDSLV